MRRPARPQIGHSLIFSQDPLMVSLQADRPQRRLVLWYCVVNPKGRILWEILHESIGHRFQYEQMSRDRRSEASLADSSRSVCHRCNVCHRLKRRQLSAKNLSPGTRYGSKTVFHPMHRPSNTGEDRSYHQEIQLAEDGQIYRRRLATKCITH